MFMLGGERVPAEGLSCGEHQDHATFSVTHPHPHHRLPSIIASRWLARTLTLLGSGESGERRGRGHRGSGARAGSFPAAGIVSLPR